MSTYEKIKAERIAAMKAKEGFRKDTLGSILAAIKQVEVDTRKELTETDVIQILTKMAKQRTESINMFMQGGRFDLAEIETYEKDIIEEFLPKQLTAEEVNVMVVNAITVTGATSQKDMGKVIGVLRPQIVGRYDMGKVSESVKALLS